MNLKEGSLDQTLIALADPTRRAILARLNSGKARVTEIAEPFPISLNSVSKHIRLLELNVRRLLDQTVANRETTVAEIRGEIKLLARTIAALAEEADQG